MRDLHRIDDGVALLPGDIEKLAQRLPVHSVSSDIAGRHEDALDDPVQAVQVIGDIEKEGRGGARLVVRRSLWAVYGRAESSHDRTSHVRLWSGRRETVQASRRSHSTVRSRAVVNGFL